MDHVRGSCMGIIYDLSERIEFKILESERREIYVIKKGDCLNRIAKQYGLKVLDIKEWNNLYSDHLSIGDKLILYILNE